MQADLLIVGDSHTAALQEAARARGLDSRMLYLSGNFWHENKMRPHPQLGLSAAYRRGLHRRVTDFAREAGGSVFPAGVPILASFGYHLGRMVPLFARNGHTPDPQQAEAEEDRLYVSQAFLDGFIAHHRGGLHRVLRLAALKADIIVIAPPLIQMDAGSRRIAARITEILTGHGLRVFDPAQEPDWAGKPLPKALRAPDNVHGNAAYGEEVLSRLFDRGMIRLAA